MHVHDLRQLGESEAEREAVQHGFPTSIPLPLDRGIYSLNIKICELISAAPQPTRARNQRTWSPPQHPGNFAPPPRPLLLLDRDPQLVQQVLRVQDSRRKFVRMDVFLERLVAFEDVAHVCEGCQRESEGGEGTDRRRGDLRVGQSLLGGAGIGEHAFVGRSARASRKARQSVHCDWSGQRGSA